MSNWPLPSIRELSGEVRALREQNATLARSLASAVARIDRMEGHRSNGLPPVYLGDVLAAISEAFDVTGHDLRSHRQTKTVAAARHAYFSLAKEMTRCSMPAIGAAVDREHTTVWYGIRSMAKRMADPDFAARYEKARKIIEDKA